MKLGDSFTCHSLDCCVGWQFLCNEHTFPAILYSNAHGRRNWGGTRDACLRQEQTGEICQKVHQNYDSDVIPRDGCKRRSLGCVYLKFWSLPEARTAVA